MTSDVDLCRKFLEDISKSSLDENELLKKSPMRSFCFCMNFDEIQGEITDVLSRHLHDLSCPRILVPSLIYKVKTAFLTKDLESFQLEKQDTDLVEYDVAAVVKELQKCFLNTCNDMESEFKTLESCQATQKVHVSLHSVKNKRRKMEDRHIYFEDLNTLFPSDQFTCPQSIYCVFDGHGGTDAADYAASQLIYNLTSCENLIAEPGEALKQAIIKTDRNFVAKAKRERLKSGATAVVVLIQDKNLTVAWLGDSQVVLCKNGNPIELMEPHKPDREDEKERIEALGGCVVFFGGWRVNGSLSVSRAIGDYEQKPFIAGEPDVAEFEMEGDEEFLILACDGLWDTVDQIEAVETVRSCVKNGTRDQAAEILVELAKKKRSMDNITVMVVYLDFNNITLA